MTVKAVCTHAQYVISDRRVEEDQSIKDFECVDMKNFGRSAHP